MAAKAASVVARQRLSHRAPAQKRGQATLARIVAATEKLLETRAFEEITVAEIVSEAETSTGSFYARFGSKEALLPYLYESYNARADAAWDAVSFRASIAGASLKATLRAFMEVVRTGPLAFNNLMRAMAVYARAHPDRLPESATTRSTRFFEMIADRFAPHMSGAQRERRARFAAYMTLTLMREHQLFGNAPLSKALGLNAEAFAAEVEAMAAAYLAAGGKK